MPSVRATVVVGSWPPTPSVRSWGAFDERHKGQRLFPVRTGVGRIGLTGWDGAGGEKPGSASAHLHGVWLQVPSSG